LLGAGLVLWHRVLLALGLRRRVDGWRRGAGLVLRGEAARFYLSAFHLNVQAENPPPELSRAEIEQRILARLDAFMQTEKELHLLVRHCRDYDEVVPHSGPTYAVGFEPALVGPGQFIRPDSWAGPHGTPGVAEASPVLEFICRVHPDQLVDVWLRINHVGADGVAAQELMSRLEQAWGVGRPLVLPAKEDWAAFSGPRPSPGRGDAAEVQTFIDFSPLLAWRKRENQKLPEPMTVAAAILWQLARHPQFAPLFLGTTVEVPAVGGLGRGVAIVVVRPTTGRWDAWWSKVRAGALASMGEFFTKRWGSPEPERVRENVMARCPPAAKSVACRGCTIRLACSLWAHFTLAASWRIMLTAIRRSPFLAHWLTPAASTRGFRPRHSRRLESTVRRRI